MTITIDLTGVTDKESLFKRLDETLIVKEWGHNWDALYDCLHDLPTGGFTEKYAFPLTIEVKNWKGLQDANVTDFTNFRKILEEQVVSHKNAGRMLEVVFIE